MHFACAFCTKPLTWSECAFKYFTKGMSIVDDSDSFVSDNCWVAAAASITAEMTDNSKCNLASALNVFHR